MQNQVKTWPFFFFCSQMHPTSGFLSNASVLGSSCKAGGTHSIFKKKKNIATAKNEKSATFQQCQAILKSQPISTQSGTIEKNKHVRQSAG